MGVGMSTMTTGWAIACGFSAEHGSLPRTAAVPATRSLRHRGAEHGRQVDEYFTAAVTDLPDSAQTRRARLDDPVEPGSTLSVRQAMDLFTPTPLSRRSGSPVPG
jgi:hypothetical protein